MDENKVGSVSGGKEVDKKGELKLEENGEYGGRVIGIYRAERKKCVVGDTLTLLSPVYFGALP